MSNFINNARYSNVVIGRKPRRRLDPRFLPQRTSRRAALLLTTTLATGLVIGVAMTPRPAFAVDCIQPASPAPILDSSATDPITCTNAATRFNAAGAAIDLRTTNNYHYIDLTNSGMLTGAGAVLEPDGIHTETTGNNSHITINNNAGGTINARQDGINAYVRGQYSDVTIRNHAAIVAGVGDAAGDGIDVFSTGYGSDIYIYNYATMIAAEDGVYAGTTDDGAQIKVHNYADITAGRDGFFLYTNGTGGGNSVYVHNTGTVHATRNGFNLFTHGSDDDITVTNSGDVFALQAGFGAKTYGDGSDIDITDTGSTIMAGTYGVYAKTYGENADITVHTSSDMLTGQDGIFTKTTDDYSDISITTDADHNINAGPDGISAKTEGYNADITIHSYSNVNATLYGIRATTTGTGSKYASSDITVHSNGNLTAGVYDGMYLVATDGNIDVTTYGGKLMAVGAPTGQANGGTGSDGANGIDARVYGPLNRHIQIVSASDIHSTDDGIYAFSTSQSSKYGDPIYSSYGDANIRITSNGHVTSARNGVSAVAYGSTPATNFDGGPAGSDIKYAGADISITVNGNVDAGHFGVFAFSGPNNADGDITINQGSNSTITSQNDGINAGAYGPNAGIYKYSNVSITANGTIRAAGSSTYGALSRGIAVEAAQYTTVEINGSVYGEEQGVFANSAQHTKITVGAGGSLTAGSDLAVYTITSGTDVYISGYVRGYMLFDTDDDVYVQDAGTWRPTDTTDFDFTGPGGYTDRVFNGGVIRTSDFGALSTERVYFDNLEEFYNGSSTGGPGLVTMVNNVVGDQINLNYNSGIGNVNFHGVGNSNLAVDTFLSGASANATDQLFIYGDTDGNTLVHVNNTNPNGSSPNYNGIPVVIVSGTTSESDFDLADAPLQAGFWSWDLQLDPDSFNQNLCTPCDVHELITIGPSSLGTALAVNITTAQEIWHETTGAWADRQADLRLQLMDGAATTTADLGDGGGMMSDEGAPSGNGNVTPGVWAKGIGVWAERDADYTIAGPPPTTFNLDHDINIKGVLGGVDFGTDATPGDAILFGLLGGYTWSNLDFDAGGGSKFEGPSVGGYGTFIHGGFYADAVVKADFLDVSIDATPFGQNGSASSNVTNVGGRLESGYKLGSRFFVEPQGSVSYMNTQFDDISLLGGQVSFNEDESLRGRAGARIGAAFGDANFSIQPDVGASVWHEFMGDNSVDVTGFSFALPTFSDSRDDTWGEVSGGISAVSASGWSVFARGKWEFADDFQALSVHGGARIAW